MSKSTLILYKSKTGFTKRYANIIAKETGGTAMGCKDGTPKLLASFDRILFGSRMHAGRIDGLSKARNLFQKNGIKLSALFVTGAMPNTETEAIEEMWKNNLTSEELTSLPHFYIQSGLCYEKMNFIDKTMMRVFSFMMKQKKHKTPEEILFSEILARSYDISSEEYVQPLLRYLTEDSSVKEHQKM